MMKSYLMENDAILSEYLERKAHRLNKPVEEVAVTVDRAEFYDTVYRLHERFMAGEFSLGYMAQLLDISKPDLYHLLDAMGLKVTNV